MILVIKDINRKDVFFGLKEDKVYFNSGTHINLESTNVNKLIDINIKKIIENLESYQKNWKWMVF